MSTDSTLGGLSIGALADRIALSPRTLREWERRYGFPLPARLPGGHRRYSARDLELLQEVRRLRERGVSTGAAIKRVRGLHDQAQVSLHDALRRRCPHLPTYRWPRSTLVGVSHAIEDAVSSGSASALLVGAFQERRFYVEAQPRWQTMSRAAALSVVLADFRSLREARPGLWEVPIGEDDPLAREWLLLARAPNEGALLSGLEVVGVAEPGKPPGRYFETVLSFEPRALGEAGRLVASRLAGQAPELAHAVLSLTVARSAPVGSTLRAADGIAQRAIDYITAADRAGP